VVRGSSDRVRLVVGSEAGTDNKKFLDAMKRTGWKTSSNRIRECGDTSLSRRNANTIGRT